MSTVMTMKKRKGPRKVVFFLTVPDQYCEASVRVQVKVQLLDDCGTTVHDDDDEALHQTARGRTEINPSTNRADD